MPSKENTNQIRLDEAVINLGPGLSLVKDRDDLQPKRRYNIDLTPLGPSVKKFRVIQNLTSGANLITHSLGLTTPFATIVQVKDSTTGSDITVQITAETTNTVTISVSTSITNARITIIG